VPARSSVPCSACVIGPAQRHVRSGQRTQGAHGLSAPRSVPSCPLPAAHTLKGQVVRVGDRWPRCPLAVILGGAKLDREIARALTLPALHRVGPRVHPEALAADRAAPPQVRVLLAVAAAVVLEQHPAQVFLRLSHSASPLGRVRCAPATRSRYITRPSCGGADSVLGGEARPGAGEQTTRTARAPACRHSAPPQTEQATTRAPGNTASASRSASTAALWRRSRPVTASRSAASSRPKRTRSASSCRRSVPPAARRLAIKACRASSGTIRSAPPGPRRPPQPRAQRGVARPWRRSHCDRPDRPHRPHRPEPTRIHWFPRDDRGPVASLRHRDRPLTVPPRSPNSRLLGTVGRLGRS